jgi:hypothetical protein
MVDGSIPTAEMTEHLEYSCANRDDASFIGMSIVSLPVVTSGAAVAAGGRIRQGKAILQSHRVK